MDLKHYSTNTYSPFDEAHHELNPFTTHFPRIFLTILSKGLRFKYNMSTGFVIVFENHFFFLSIEKNVFKR